MDVRAKGATASCWEDNPEAGRRVPRAESAGENGATLGETVPKVSIYGALQK
jgi:hypothetical protein